MPHAIKGSKRDSRFLDGIVGGERVIVAKPRAESERAIEIRIRIALAALGFIVWKHTVESCWHCGKKPTKRTGLGEGMSDLLVLIPGGRVVFIEIKLPGYPPSAVRPMQKRRLAHLRRNGFISGIATSEEEAIALVKEAGARVW